MSALHAYFRHLADYGRGLMDRLPISDRIEPLAESFNRLNPVLESRKAEELAHMRAVVRPEPDRTPRGEPVGMNSIGILLDRLTILICKEWFLRHRQKRAEAADELYRTQTLEIVGALALARPGDAKLLEKVSTIRTEASADSFEDAYYGLLAANLLMWETQEVLYIRDMEAMPAEELRDYIRFFSQANMRRNAYIALGETRYWSGS